MYFPELFSFLLDLGGQRIKKKKLRYPEWLDCALLKGPSKVSEESSHTRQKVTLSSHITLSNKKLTSLVFHTEKPLAVKAMNLNYYVIP